MPNNINENNLNEYMRKLYNKSLNEYNLYNEKIANNNYYYFLKYIIPIIIDNSNGSSIRVQIKLFGKNCMNISIKQKDNETKTFILPEHLTDIAYKLCINKLFIFIEVNNLGYGEYDDYYQLADIELFTSVNNLTLAYENELAKITNDRHKVLKRTNNK